MLIILCLYDYGVIDTTTLLLRNDRTIDDFLVMGFFEKFTSRIKQNLEG